MNINTIRIPHGALSALLLALVACGPGRTADQPVEEPGAAPTEQSRSVAIRASNGKYVCADQAEGIARLGGLMANRESVGDWERFTLIELDSTHCALRASNGKYVTAVQDGPFQAVAERDSIGDGERFELIDLANGKVAIRTAAGKYFAAELAESAACPLCIVTDRADQGEWESFELLPAESIR